LYEEGHFTECQAIKIFKQLLSAVQAMSERNIVHRDLKPSNILFHDGVMKLGDFGFCKILKAKELTKTMVGSPIYMAPEILEGQKYNTSCDI